MLCFLLRWVVKLIKEILSDSKNIILWHESEHLNKQKSLFAKFQLILILRFQVIHDYLCFIAPIDYCVKFCLVDETFCQNCYHFVLKWLQPYSCGEMCFLEESYKNFFKNSNFDNFESALYSKSGRMPLCLFYNCAPNMWHGIPKWVESCIYYVLDPNCFIQLKKTLTGIFKVISALRGFRHHRFNRWILLRISYYFVL